METEDKLFRVDESISLQELCRIHNLTPMNCGSRMKLKEDSDDDSLDYDDNTCFILSVIMHNVKKWKKLNRDMFFHKIMDNIEKMTFTPELTTGIISAIDESMKPNHMIDALLCHVWSRVETKNMCIHHDNKLHYYFFNEFQHACMCDENTIYFDFDNEHFIPLIKSELLDDEDTMTWYEQNITYQDNIETKLEKLNTDVAKQLLELDTEQAKLNMTSSGHDENNDMEIAKALQEEEDKKTRALRQSIHMNNRLDIGQYERDRRIRDQYRNGITDICPSNIMGGDRFSDMKMCNQCSNFIHRKHGLYWCYHCHKIIEDEDEDDNNYGISINPNMLNDNVAEQYIPCKMCGQKYKQAFNGLHIYCNDCNIRTGPDDENAFIIDSDSDSDTNVNILTNPNPNPTFNRDNRDTVTESGERITFKPCKTCARMIKQQNYKFYCVYCNEYTIPGNNMPQCNDMNMQQLTNLDKKDNDRFWDCNIPTSNPPRNYNRYNQIVDDDYFERDYPNNDPINDISSSFKNNTNNNFSNSNSSNNGSKFWEKSSSDQNASDVVFDPLYNEKYGNYDPNFMNEEEIDTLNTLKAMRESSNVNDDDDEELQRALKESKEMYMETNVEESNIFAEEFENDLHDNEISDNDSEYFYNNYLPVDQNIIDYLENEKNEAYELL